MHSHIVLGSPRDTIQFLVSLDPAFETELEDEDLDSMNHHAVMALFAQYFGANVGGFTVNQLRRLGDWLSAAVAAGGDIENAVSTCFLEHAHQLKVNRILRPFLSKEAKGQVHA
jgi:hypothetical protein